MINDSEGSFRHRQRELYDRVVLLIRGDDTSSSSCSSDLCTLCVGQSVHALATGTVLSLEAHQRHSRRSFF
jgi:hypothetical protein